MVEEISEPYQGIAHQGRAILGESGMMNFENIFRQAYANGIKDYFVELEGMPDGRSQFEGVKGCVDYLLKAPFVR